MTGYSKLKVAELKEELKSRGLKVTGKKAELVERLEEADAGGHDDDDPPPEMSNKRAASEPADGETDTKRVKTEAESQDSGKTESQPEEMPGVKEESKPALDEAAEQKPTADEMQVDRKPKVEESESKPSTAELSESKPKLEGSDTKPDIKAEEADQKPAVKSEETDSKPDVKTEETAEAAHGTILERGHIFFFYRPKVNLTESDVSGIEDVARFEMILKPHEEKLYRHINVGRKQLPHESGGSRRPFWSAVTAVDGNVDNILEKLKSNEYDTKTQGHRTQPAARPAGRGSYVIHVEGEKSKRATHLAYVLSEPSEAGPVQKDLSIHKEGAFVIQVKDPHADGPAGASLPADRRAKYPEKLQSLFRTKFRLAEPPQLLDYAGVELLLIAAKHELDGEIGAGEQKKLEREAEEEASANKDIFAVLNLSSKEHPAAAIKDGEWV